MPTNVNRLKNAILGVINAHLNTDPANIVNTREQVALELATVIVAEIKNGTVTVAGVQPGAGTATGTIS